MPRFKRIVVDGPNFFEEIVLPSFGDFIGSSDVRNGFHGEFMIMDDVADSKKIIEISRVSNILKRRDASCKLLPSWVGKADARRISVTELYGYVEHCAQEFYQGCLKDWRNGDPAFVGKIYDFFIKAIADDLISLNYFGDVDSPEVNGQKWNINKYDGIFKKYKGHIASGRIPGSQTFNIPNGDITPANAKAYIAQAYESRDQLMRLMPKAEQAFYVDEDLYDAYEDYLIATGQTNGEAVNYVQDGIKVRAYKGIPIFKNPIYKPVLKQLTGNDAHLLILTLRGNFIFATDSKYGEGPDRNVALKVWYDWDEMIWKYVNFLKAGTEISLPEHSVLGLPQ